MTPDDILALRAVAERAEKQRTNLKSLGMSPERRTADDEFQDLFGPPTVLALLDRLAALEEVAEYAEELKLWEPGRRGYAAAQNALFASLDRLQSSGAGKRDPCRSMAPAPDDVKEEK